MPASSPTYHVGDHVIVRTWDSMMEEYGSDPYGSIAVHPNKLSFVLGMKPYCGKEFIVARIIHNKNLPDEPIYFLNYLPGVHVDLNDGGSPYGWYFTSAMLLPVPATLPPLNPKTVFPPLLLPSMIYFKESNNYEYCP